MQKLFIISNESIYENNGKYFCDNIDLKSTPEGLNKDFEVNLIARKAKKDKTFTVNLNKIKIFNSIFSFLLEIFNSTKNKNVKYLIISITPYTFLAPITLKIFGKSPLLYLRSDGYGEYKAILGFIGPFIYHIMFSISSSISKLVSCRNYILKGKRGDILSPSQLDQDWFKNIDQKSFDKVKLLYVGRIRKEKGIFSLINLLKNKDDISLTILGEEKHVLNKIDQKNIFVKKSESDKLNLIKYYDNHNIFILPSFTEGHPMALLEALARRRPVIIFEEIKHVIGDKKGIFVSKRNTENLIETIDQIKNDYKNIQDSMKENTLPTNKDFIQQMGNIINNVN